MKQVKQTYSQVYLALFYNLATRRDLTGKKEDQQSSEKVLTELKETVSRFYFWYGAFSLCQIKTDDLVTASLQLLESEKHCSRAEQKVFLLERMCNIRRM